MSTKHKRSDWWWIGGGAIIGGTILGLVFMREHVPTPTTISPGSTPTASSSSTSVTTSPGLSSSVLTQTASTSSTPPHSGAPTTLDGYVLPKNGACPTGSVPLMDYKVGQLVCVPPCSQSGDSPFWNGSNWICTTPPDYAKQAATYGNSFGWYTGLNAIASATMQAKTLAASYPNVNFYVVQYTPANGGLQTVVLNQVGLNQYWWDGGTPHVIAVY